MIEDVVAFISFGVVIANSIATAAMYWRYVKMARGVFSMLRADDNGEIETIDSLH